jgi:hypothetical protein
MPDAHAAPHHVNPASGPSEHDYEAAPILRTEHAEASLTRLLEQQTARIPSHVFLTLAFAAMATSLVLELRGRSRMSRFVGMWPPTLLITGVYNKLVKLLGPR